MKTKLNKAHRLYLINHALLAIKPTAELDKQDEAYQKFLRELKIQYEKTYPEAEREILEKHGVMQSDAHPTFFITHQDRDTEVQGVSLMKEDFLRLPYIDYDSKEACTVSSVSRLAILFKKLDEACLETNKAEIAIKEDMEALIFSSKTFEDVVEIWPGAADLQDEICRKSTQLSTLGEDTIKRIKSYSQL